MKEIQRFSSYCLREVEQLTEGKYTQKQLKFMLEKGEINGYTLLHKKVLRWYMNTEDIKKLMGKGKLKIEGKND